MSKAAQTDPKVDALMAALDHPLKAEIEAVRRLILDLGPDIREAVKWKAPTFFRGDDDFATVNLRSPDSLQLILHLGAKVRPGLAEIVIDDPGKLLKRLAVDRRMASLGVGEAFEASAEAFRAVLKAWIVHL